MLNATLDLAIGLSYIFLVLSLIVTSVTEMLSSYMNWRSADLKRGIVSLLQNPALAKRFFAHPLIASLTELQKDFSLNLTSAATLDPTSKTKSSPSIEDILKKIKAPSYIDSADFVAVVYNDICGASPHLALNPAELKALLESVPYDGLRKTLQTLASEAGYDVDKFKEAIGTWFDRGMDRVSGWYKRRVQNITLWVGLAVVIILNVNALSVAQQLYLDEPLRGALADQAANYVAQEKGTTPTNAGAAAEVKVLNGMNLHVGWAGTPKGPGPKVSDRPRLKYIIFSIPGWCLTAVAVSLGAPFWFDMLKQIMGIRSAGKKPKSSTEDTDSDDGKDP